MQCYIDNQHIELGAHPIRITLRAERATQPYSEAVALTDPFQIPLTGANRKALGLWEIHQITPFNQQLRRARIEKEACLQVEGVVRCISCESSPTGELLTLQIFAPPPEWVTHAAQTRLPDTAIALSEQLSALTISQSWSWEKPLLLLPVLREEMRSPATTTHGGVHSLSMSNYYPFFHLYTLLETIVQEGGYTLQSEFLQSELFQSLYFSGMYPQIETEIPKERMDFRAGRFDSNTATADHFGRIYADPFTASNSLGNFVDTADPNEAKEGRYLPTLYTNNGCFRKSGSRPGFFPIDSGSVCFEYTLRYATDYRIRSRTRLWGIDTIYLHDQVARLFPLVNKHEDRRSDYQQNHGYTLIVFNHREGNTYQFQHSIVSSSGNSNNKPTTLKTFSSRTTSITVPSSSYYTYTDPTLLIQQEDGSYEPYSDDWALYDGYVAERGEMEVMIQVRSNNQLMEAGEGIFFDTIYFGGAEMGMQMTLHQDVSLTPIFTEQPGAGDQVSFADLCAHRITQLDLIEGVAHLFQLYFRSDPATRTLYVEPREHFYSSEVVDWSERIDRSEPIHFEELSGDRPQGVAYGYQAGDRIVAAWESAHDEHFGSWQTSLLNRFTSSGVSYQTNPLFAPTLSRQGDYHEAPSAQLLSAGGETDTPLEEDNLNLSARIISYHGIAPLPTGEWWGWPTYNNHYPKAAFHDPLGETPSLCFEDQDGQQGLHRYYDRNIAELNHGRRIELSLRLAAHEIEPFVKSCGAPIDFSRRFRLTIEGEPIYARLTAILDYDPQNEGSTRCQFITD